MSDGDNEELLSGEIACDCRHKSELEQVDSTWVSCSQITVEIIASNVPADDDGWPESEE